MDLANAQRFYQVLNSIQVTAYTSGGGLASASDLVYPVPMRAMPTAVLSNQSYGNATALTVGPVSFNAAQRTITLAAGGNGWATCNVALSADL
jgi:hypothetical protein